MTFAATQATNDAMLVGGLSAFIDAGVPPAFARIYAGDTLLVTMVFKKPAVTLVNHELIFSQGSAGGDQILTTGDADSFSLYNGLGQLIGSGDVSASDGAGALKISGTTGTTLYAGARAILGELKFA